ncbi:DUF6708 domain-containing protein [Chitinivorax sp. B]|uniref:DUF6708 domain-containing protein n=1 Tax=Chitinivorax sp. B TaxID=2502235 RepID=UPI0010F8C936|nr:DUF6708 domain-containing protein [Chitinivorax sp. B]
MKTDKPTTPGLLRHGEYTSPHLQLAPQVIDADHEQAEADPDTLHGVVERYTNKKQRVHDDPSAMANVAAIYRDAVAFNDPAASAMARGMGIFANLHLLFIFIFLGVADIHHEMIEAFRNFEIIGILVFLISGMVVFFIFMPIFWALLKFDLFGVDDLPVIFDRKRRKVYRLLMPLDGSGERHRWLMRPVRLQAAEYDWACIEAEYRVTLMQSGRSAARAHALVLVVYHKPVSVYQTDNQVIDEIYVGNSLMLGQDTVQRLWEHIRRYMEQNGPPIQQGEPMLLKKRPRTLWQSLGIFAPLGADFARWWRDDRWLTLFYFATAPFSVPYFGLMGVCNWLSYLTSRRTVWPDALAPLLGEPVRLPE